MRLFFLAVSALASAAVGVNQYSSREGLADMAADDGSPMRFGIPASSHQSASNEGSTEALIRRVATKYGVPAGALYGIWSVESGRLSGGWGNSRGWLLARDVIRPDGVCTQKYGRAWCLRHWQALRTICHQMRRDGSRVCDPQTVRTSYALAMGPMQHIPAEVVRYDQDGTPSWTGRAADFDGDGAVDPHSLPDALAMSAIFLRQAQSRTGSWRKAVNAYYGSQGEGYAEGTTSGFKGVFGHWQDWCSRHGCTTSE